MANLATGAAQEEGAEFWSSVEDLINEPSRIRIRIYGSVYTDPYLILTLSLVW